MKVKIFLLNIFFSITAFSQAVIKMNPSSCNGNSGLIEINGGNGNFYDGYQWYWRPINSSAAFLPISGATGDSFIFDWATYNYTEIVVWCIYNAGGSYFSTTLDIDSKNCNLGIKEEISVSQRLNLFLDQESNLLYLTSQDAIDEIEIFNLTGEKILSQRSSTNNIQTDVSIFQSGIYILSARFGNKFKNVKFVKI